MNYKTMQTETLARIHKEVESELQNRRSEDAMLKKVLLLESLKFNLDKMISQLKGVPRYAALVDLVPIDDANYMLDRAFQSISEEEN